MPTEEFKPGKIFETTGSHSLHAREMITPEAGAFDRYLTDLSGKHVVCAGCKGILREVQACLANARTVGITKGPTAISYQCSQSAIEVLANVMEEDGEL